ncbi:MAG: nitrogen regulation protein NR(II) [Syntrophobacteraceae bacterium]
MPKENLINDSRLRGGLKKLLLYRLILAVFLLFITLAVQSSRNADLLSAHLHPLYVFSCALFLFTIFGAISLERVRHLIFFAWVQLLFDIVAVTVLIFLAGGIESSFSFLYILVIISSALLLYRRGSLLTASACSLVYGLLLDLQYFGWISPLQIMAPAGQARDSGTFFSTIVLNIAGFYLVALLAGYLAEELQRSSRRVREHEKNLRELATLHQSIVQSMTSGVMTIALDGRIMFSNNAGNETLGLSGQSLAGRQVEELFPSLDILQFPGGGETGSQKSTGRMELFYSHPSGQQITVGYSASVLQNETGEPFGWVVIFKDLTQVKIAEEHMQRMERLVLAGKFAAEIAHEIKNPLAAMSGAMQMLQDEVGQNALHSRLMGIVQREIGRINELVTEFLWLAKGPPKATRIENMPVCSEIEEILEILRARNQITASHTIKTSFQVRPLISMDSHHLRQVLWNLLVNALEAMPGGGELSILIDGNCSCDKGVFGTRIEIGDTGYGIPEGVRNRIFDPFFTTKTSGTGLGLSIVYQLVEKSGGRIEVSSQPSGTGTLFSLFFPPAQNF